MSTVGTQLNWGTSYLINDFYRRFLVRKATDKHYVFASKMFIVLLVILSGYAAANINSIQSAWQLLLGMGAGTGSVLLLRWYWWRINAWSEISAMVAAFVVSISLQRVHFEGNDSVVFAKAALIESCVDAETLRKSTSRISAPTRGVSSVEEIANGSSFADARNEPQ